MARILRQDGADTQTSGHFYVAVVQTILLSGSETRAIPHIKRIMGGFHNRLVHRILGNMPRQRAEGTWEYPPLGETMRVDGIEETETNIYRRQDTVVQYIAACPILDLCLDTDRRSGLQAPTQWLGHEGLLLAERSAEGGG